LIDLFEYLCSVLKATVAVHICMCMKQIRHLWVFWVSYMVQNRKKNSTPLHNIHTNTCEMQCTVTLLIFSETNFHLKWNF